uniref:Uncharacterized protein n=1 Tax=Myoviridae sp. ctBCv9 TaxID=2825045 RepID=A0A8S5U6B5_9CAUD|nr:MAG TPA: hypothetical protein [Myoviridae sp. ctBCv9]
MHTSPLPLQELSCQLREAMPVLPLGVAEKGGGGFYVEHYENN